MHTNAAARLASTARFRLRLCNARSLPLVRPCPRLGRILLVFRVLEARWLLGRLCTAGVRPSRLVLRVEGLVLRMRLLHVQHARACGLLRHTPCLLRMASRKVVGPVRLAQMAAEVRPDVVPVCLRLLNELYQQLRDLDLLLAAAAT